MLLFKKIENAYIKNKKLLFVLLDPDNFDEKSFINLLENDKDNKISAFFVGGSLITKGDLSLTINKIKKLTSLPICLFPGCYNHIDKNADAILFMSLISGRNPEFLIGNQVIAAPYLKKTKLEIIPTGYILIDGGKMTSVNYMSNTLPIPSDKYDIASSTALAGQMLGMKCIYMDSGSGANNHISENMIKNVTKNINIPLIIGGGITSAKIATSIYKAGATAIVIGSILEKKSNIINEIKF